MFSSPILVAVRNATTGRYQSLCKVMSGFTDQFYVDMTHHFKQRLLPQAHSDYDVTPTMMPPMWFPPTQVWYTQ
jgi:DNA ligase-1